MQGKYYVIRRYVRGSTGIPHPEMESPREKKTEKDVEN